MLNSKFKKQIRDFSGPRPADLGPIDPKAYCLVGHRSLGSFADPVKLTPVENLKPRPKRQKLL